MKFIFWIAYAWVYVLLIRLFQVPAWIWWLVRCRPCCTCDHCKGFDWFAAPRMY
jgi:hypothetical protein